MNRFLLFFVTLALLGTSLNSVAQSGWTSACSAGATIDEASLSLYQTNGSSLLFRPGMIGTITARYNVTNTASPSSSIPPWTTFELGYTNRANAEITATLVQVKPCTGETTTICSMTTQRGVLLNCITCTFPVGTIDFSNYVYYVQVDITRSVAALFGAQANTLRIY